MKKKHSDLGIASFIINVVYVIFIVLISINQYLQYIYTEHFRDYFLLIYLLVSLLAFGLGIGGLMQKDRKKLFVNLGIIFSVLTILLDVVFIVLNIYLSVLM